MTKTVNKNDFIFAVGRRREAIARVRLYKIHKAGLLWGDKEIKKGEIYVNKKPIPEYFSGEVSRSIYTLPFISTNTLDKYTITINVTGGGISGQIYAVVHGISRALSKLDRENFRPLLKKKGLLTRDPRARERRKVGTGGKARRKKQSPKR
ncbi:MAG: 30S ribosomal protein S9 [Patescibacteria group bacterium]|nr:30S ribosomal protein S9 [Patescibacteria group bacterium]